MKTVIEMAKQAGAMPIHKSPKELAVVGNEAIERFAELVRADAIAKEREKYKWDVHSCGPACTKVACVARRKAVEDEREACAKVCDEAHELMNSSFQGVASAIRARGNK